MIEISTMDVVTITPDTTIIKAIGIMEKSNFHNLVVLTSDDIYLASIQDLLMASNPESYLKKNHHQCIFIAIIVWDYRSH